MFPKAQSITLVRWEGPSHLCNIPETVATFADADKVLRQWKINAPAAGHGYHKCGFTITFTDGAVYDGRIDLSDDTTACLPTHCLHALTYSSNRRKPAKYTAEQWQMILARAPDRVGECAKWLYGYHFNDHPGKYIIDLYRDGKLEGSVIDAPGLGYTSSVSDFPTIFASLDEANNMAKHFVAFEPKVVPANCKQLVI
jgi:hypothetical protein